MAVKHRIEIQFEDGTSQFVTVDQRDFVQAEEAGFFTGDSREVTRQRHLAWSAAVRQGVTILTWNAFNKKIVSADVVADGGDETLDPTRPTPPHAG